MKSIKIIIACASLVLSAAAYCNVVSISAEVETLGKSTWVSLQGKEAIMLFHTLKSNGADITLEDGIETATNKAKNISCTYVPDLSDNDQTCRISF